MNHKFTASKINPTQCSFAVSGQICNRDILSHTDRAICDSCSTVGLCDLHENQLLCTDCRLKSTDDLIKRVDEVAAKNRLASQIIIKAERANLAGLTFSGDLFNAKLTSFAELSRLVNEDESISQDDKYLAFQRLVAERIIEINKRCNILDEDKRQLVIERMAAVNALRQYGGQIRDEIRNRLKETDSTYQPVINSEAIKKSLRSKAAKSPFERAAEVMALNTGKSLEECRQIMLGGLKSSETK